MEKQTQITLAARKVIWVRFFVFSPEFRQRGRQTKKPRCFFMPLFPDGGMARLVSAFRFLLLGANNAGVRQKLRTPFLTARRFVILL